MTTRICSQCQEPKDIEDFPLRNQFTQRRQSYCNECRSKMGKNWYENNKDYQKANAKKHMTEYRETAKEYVFNYLLTHPCVECGESNPVVLEFHHLSGKDKAIAELTHAGVSIAKIQEELAKCQVLCANCHRKLTASERGWFRSRK